nr:phasin family protein [Methylobacterium sp. ZNC0032]
MAAKAPPPPPASLDSLPLPRPPEAAAVVTATAMSQALTMARAFGALQARMLDHACAELEATLGDAQTLARSNSASEAIALQAKAVRRSYESYAEHLKELARTANAALRKD